MMLMLWRVQTERYKVEERKEERREREKRESKLCNSKYTSKIKHIQVCKQLNVSIRNKLYISFAATHCSVQQNIDWICIDSNIEFFTWSFWVGEEKQENNMKKLLKEQQNIKFKYFQLNFQNQPKKRDIIFIVQIFDTLNYIFRFEIEFFSYQFLVQIQDKQFWWWKLYFFHSQSFNLKILYSIVVPTTATARASPSTTANLISNWNLKLSFSKSIFYSDSILLLLLKVHKC